jgi:Zn-dependent protease
VDPQILYALLACGIMLLFGFPVHEFFHAYTAYRLGDSTARYLGRLTLDPRKHFDPIGGSLLVFSALLSRGSFFFGFAKPTPVNPMNLQGGRHGEALVSAAGPVSNLVMAALVAIPIRIILASPDLARQVLTSDAANTILQVAYYFVVINIFLFIFNLLPIPPLDGWRVLLGLVPPRTAWQLRQIEVQYATIIPIVFMGFVLLGGARILTPISTALIDLLLGT